MARMLLSPSKYMQGARELANLGRYTTEYGKKAFILTTEFAYKSAGSMLEEGFKRSKCEYIVECFQGECSRKEINRLKEVAKQEACDVIIGLGGGKILDIAKAVAYYANTPVIICPTSASTDAPCSAISVLYSDEGIMEQYLYLPSNPNLVLVDTEIIANAPVRLTVSGMGDALSTYIEARAVKAKGAKTALGGQATEAAFAIAKLCFDTLMEEGVKAKRALEAGECTEAVEKIIEANILLSGIGFESVGLAGAHAVQNGLNILEECRHMYHGEKVAFGTIVQLVLEDAPVKERDRVIDFCIAVGLPVTLEELGIIEGTEEIAMQVAQAACAEGSTMNNMAVEVTVESVCAAILAASQFGKQKLKKA
ncbi:glycerol dehydrogenase [Anaerosporobacter sp.]|uniref:glycerol dehydrogenase n=1 Tax=Anaerosporobacter sp. TaxID=1872529 RepID=UPI00286F3B51|nr:glycerol dehydrogenase [Anaerosporobacter sp.]